METIIGSLKPVDFSTISPQHLEHPTLPGEQNLHPGVGFSYTPLK